MSRTEKRRILFIYTRNSARSQMAEGFVKPLFPDNYEVLSGGTEPSPINPYVVKVMAESGIDISGQSSKNVYEFLDREIDYVVTVCDQVQETCPFFTGGKTYIHKSFQDPSVFQGTEEEILEQVREVRDGVKDWIGKTFDPRLKKMAE